MYFKSVRKGLQKVLPDVVTGIDIGTSKVCCYIARLNSSQIHQIIGCGYEASKGIKNGSIVDMEALSNSIARATHAAEQMAQVTINEVFVSLSASLAQSHVVDMTLPISGRAVLDQDIGKMISHAVDSAQSLSTEVIHRIPLSYHVDSMRGIRDPRGMFGSVLGTSVHLITTNAGPLRNFLACIERCHLEVTDFVVAPYASGLASLVEDELDLGVTLVDMGAGSTSIGIFYEGKLHHVDHVNVGGGHVTSDIARGLSTPLNHAERLKILYGSAMVSPMASAEERTIVRVPQIGEDDINKGVQVNKSELVRIIRPRIEETFELLRERLKLISDLSKISKRLVLTGGASQLVGVRELASMILDKHTRIGKPIHIQGVDERMRTSSFSTCAGLIALAKKDQKNIHEPHKKMQNDNLSVFGRIGSWLKDNL